MLTVRATEEFGLIMTLSHEDLERLQNRLAADRKAMEEKERALALVMQMIKEENSKEPPAHQVNGSNDRFKNMSFAEAAREAVKDFDGDFTSKDIDNFLLLNLKAERPKKPRSMISMALGELENKGLITVVKKGSGVRPNIYRRKR